MKIYKRIFLSVFSLLLLVQPLFADWTMEHMNAANDRVEVPIELPLQPLWKKKYSNFSEPVMMDGCLYVLECDQPLL